MGSSLEAKTVKNVLILSSGVILGAAIVGAWVLLGAPGVEGLSPYDRESASPESSRSAPPERKEINVDLQLPPSQKREEPELPPPRREKLSGEEESRPVGTEPVMIDGRVIETQRSDYKKTETETVVVDGQVIQTQRHPSADPDSDEHKSNTEQFDREKMRRDLEGKRDLLEDSPLESGQIEQFLSPSETRGGSPGGRE